MAKKSPPLTSELLACLAGEEAANLRFRLKEIESQLVGYWLRWLQTRIGNTRVTTEHIQQAAIPLEELWRSVEGQISKLAPKPDLQPLPPANHLQQLRFVLTRLGILKDRATLDLGPTTDTGAGGKSVIYFLTITSAGEELRLVAKFDQPERAKREWDVLRELQFHHVPTEVLLPLAGNIQADGVILYPMAGTSALPQITKLKDYLLSHLAEAPASAIRCLKKVLSPLRTYVYQPSGLVDGEQKLQPWYVYWWDFFFDKNSTRIPSGPLKDNKAFQEFVESITAKARELWSGVPEGLKDCPIDRLQVILERTPGPLLLSRIHGDLNLTNVVLCCDGLRNPAVVYLIDWAESRNRRPTAIDLSRLEAEFWSEVYFDSCTQRDISQADSLASFIKACRYLNGWPIDNSTGGWKPDRFLLGAMEYVHDLRKRARRILSSQQGRSHTSYGAEDYFTCLYLNYIRQTTWSRFQGEHQARGGLALCGAALALEVLDGISVGRYGDGARAESSLHPPCRGNTELEAFFKSSPGLSGNGMNS